MTTAEALMEFIKGFAITSTDTKIKKYAKSHKPTSFCIKNYIIHIVCFTLYYIQIEKVF